jgi:hypothetical protein
MFTYQDYKNELKNSQGNIFKPVSKIEILRDDETVKKVIPLKDNLGGTLSINKQNGLRRKISFSLMNDNKDYIPKEDGLWFYTKFKLWLGLEINGEEYYLQQGIFIVENIEVTSNGSETKVNVSALDKYSMLDGQIFGELEASYELLVNTPVADAIRRILFDAGDKNTPVIDNDFTTILTPYTLRLNGGDNLGKLLEELSEMCSSDFYYNEDGIFVFERFVEDNTKPSIQDFTTDDILYLGGSKRYNLSEVYNGVRAEGTNVNGNSISATVKNENLKSNTNIFVTREKLKHFTSNSITTLEQATLWAEYQLRQIMALKAEGSYTCMRVIFHLDVNKVITITDNNLDSDRERFLIQSITIPFGIGSGTSSFNAVNTNELEYS